MIKRRPATPQPMESPFGGDRSGRTVEVDAFSLTPLVDYLRGRVDRLTLTNEPAPEMFSTGQLPPFTASGVDPEVLRLVHWRIRTSAASTPDRALVYRMVDAGADGWAEEGLVTESGEIAWRSYVSDTWKWATAPAPSEEVPITDAEYDAFWSGRTA